MAFRLHPLAIGLLGLLIVAVPVPSQLRTDANDSAAQSAVPNPPAGFTQASNSSPIYDMSPRPATLEPRVEPLPPVEEEQPLLIAASPGVVPLPPTATHPIHFEPSTAQAPDTLPADSAQSTTSQFSDSHFGRQDLPMVSSPHVEGFERINVPQGEKILSPDLFGPDAPTEKKSGSDGNNNPNKIWNGNFKFGLDGADGNTQNLNFHVGFNVQRKTKRSNLTGDLDYNKSNNDSVDTANRLFAESRLERFHISTPWTWYAHNSADYDEFQPWDIQVSLDTGFGYQLIENETTDLVVRFGGGFSREVGGPDDNFVPELLFGANFEHRMGERQKIKLSIEFFPDATDFTEYRMVDKASWEVLLDSKRNLSMSLNAINTVNRPNPGGKESDLNYSAVLLWSF